MRSTDAQKKGHQSALATHGCNQQGEQAAIHVNFDCPEAFALDCVGEHNSHPITLTQDSVQVLADNHTWSGMALHDAGFLGAAEGPTRSLEPR